MSARGFYSGPAYVVSPVPASAPKSYARGMCTVPGCKNEQRSDGMCQTHVVRKARGQSLYTPVRAYSSRVEQPVCSVAGCELLTYSRGMCAAHDARARRGRPLDAPVRPRSDGAHPIARVSDVLQRVRVSAGELQPQFAARLQVLPTTVELAEAGRLPTREAAVRYAQRVLERCAHALTTQQRAVLGAYVGAR